MVKDAGAAEITWKMYFQMRILQSANFKDILIHVLH